MPSTIESQRLSNDVATTFIYAHTIVDDNVPLLEECPICLDNYSTESCLEITGIEGCNHRVGMKCLRQMLQSSPDEEKRCPLCRTVWVTAPANRALSTSRRMAGIFEDFDSIGDSIERPVGAGIAGQPSNRTVITEGPGTHNPQNVGLLSVQNLHRRNATIEDPILVDSDSDDGGYEAQLENFEQFRRDIEHVRMRAQNTRLSRARRRLELSGPVSSSSTSSQPEGAIRGRTRNITPGLSGATGGFNLFNRNRNPFRTTAADNNPPLSITAARDHECNRSVTRHSAPGRRSRSRMRTQDLRLTSVSSFSRHTEFSHARPTNADVDDVIEISQSQAQSTLNATQNRQLEKREEDLNNRETALNIRETDVTQREQRANELMNSVRAQQKELQNVLTRQLRDLESAMQ